MKKVKNWWTDPIVAELKKRKIGYAELATLSGISTTAAYSICTGLHRPRVDTVTHAFRSMGLSVKVVKKP
jgi:lambda repressor-like predicted transcriptional regulator